MVGDAMKKEFRVKKSQEIEMIMKKGSSKANPYFIIYKYQNPNNKHFRIAISVGKKVGIAVTRNQVKRRIRAITTEHKDQMNPNYDYFIIARKGVEQLDYKDFKLKLEQIYRKMNIIPKQKEQNISTTKTSTKS